MTSNNTYHQTQELTEVDIWTTPDKMYQHGLTWNYEMV